MKKTENKSVQLNLRITGVQAEFLDDLVSMGIGKTRSSIIQCLISKEMVLKKK